MSGWYYQALSASMSGNSMMTTLWFPVVTLRHLVTSTLRQVAPAMLSDHRPDLHRVFLEFGRVGDDVFDNQVSCHLNAPVYGCGTGLKRLLARDYHLMDGVL
jgi:hypothetical protein